MSNIVRNTCTRASVNQEAPSHSEKKKAFCHFEMNEPWNEMDASGNGNCDDGNGGIWRWMTQSNAFYTTVVRIWIGNNTV